MLSGKFPVPPVTMSGEEQTALRTDSCSWGKVRPVSSRHFLNQPSQGLKLSSQGNKVFPGLLVDFLSKDVCFEFASSSSIVIVGIRDDLSLKLEFVAVSFHCFVILGSCQRLAYMLSRLEEVLDEFR